MSAKSKTKMTMMIPVPVVAPLGWTVDNKQMVQEVWDVFVKPAQERGDLPSIEMRVLMAILRAVYEGMPDE
jgi:hypothetical protein